MADPLYQKQVVCDSSTGMCTPYLFDPMTGQQVTLMDASGQAVAPTPYYELASRMIGPDGTTPALQATYPGGYGPAPAPQRLAVTPQGQALPGLTSSLPAPATESTAAGSLPAGGGAPSSGYDYRSGWGGYGSRRYYGGGSSGGYGGGYDSGSTVPRYANGQTHPFFGGEPLTPGGFWNQGDDGYDDRQQVTSSSGATAGPFGTRAARAPRYDPPGSPGGGGGGGIARDLYWKFANAIKDKVMGGGASSGSYGSYEPYRQPRPYRGPDDPRTQRKLDRFNLRRESEASTYGHPEFAIPRFVDLESPMGQRLSGLPGMDLTLMAGAGKKNWKGGIDPTADVYEGYYDKLNKRLGKGKSGIDFFPYYKKQMRKDRSLDQYNGLLQRIYDQAAGGSAFDTQGLFQNLSDPRKGTYLHQQFKNAAPGTAADQYQQSFGAILQSGGYGDIQRGGLALLANNAITDYGRLYAGKNPRRIPPLNRFVAGALAPYV